LFQSKAPGDGDGDDVTVVADTEGGPLEVQEITNDLAQAESPQKDAEADANTERAEV
jgi:hypothetical protein